MPKHFGYVVDIVVFVLQDDTTPIEVTTFILKHQFPLVATYDGKMKERYDKDKNPIIIFFYSVDWSFDHREGECKSTGLAPIHKFDSLLEFFCEYAFV
jgi:hypothetical protein